MRRFVQAGRFWTWESYRGSCSTIRSVSCACRCYCVTSCFQGGIARQKTAGNDVTGLEAYGPLPLTLKSRLIEKGTYSWIVPVVVKCGKPFTKMRTADRITKEIWAFINVKGYAGERPRK